jgi:hypothetical protein
MKIHFNGKTYTIDELKALPEFAKAGDSVIAHGPGLSTNDEAFAFTTEPELKDWVEKQPIGKQLEGLFEKLGKARTEASGDLSLIKKRQIAKAKRVEEDLRSLAEETGLKYGSEELFLRATRDSRILEGPVFDPASLYTGSNFTGNSLGAAVPLPNLSWFAGMNNSITSVQVLGVCILYTQTLFGGPALWLVGAPYYQIANLAGTGFNNAASSAYVYIW